MNEVDVWFRAVRELSLCPRGWWVSYQPEWGAIILESPGAARS